MGIFDDILKVDSPEETGQEEPKENEGPIEEGQPSEETEETKETKEEQKTEEQKAVELLLGKFKTVDDLAKAYKELEKKLGSRDEEKERLRQENEQAKAYLAQLMQYLQTIQGQNPQTQQGQFTPPVEEEVNPEKWLEEFYSEGPKAVKKLLEKELQKQGALLGQTLNQILNPILQYVIEDAKEKTAAQYRKEFEAQRDALKAKYEDFEDVKQTMIELYDEDPRLATVPMEVVYHMAKARLGKGQETEASKQAAKIPSSTGRVTGKKQSPDEEVLDRIFGKEEKKGIFG